MKCSVYFDAHDSQLLNELCIDQFRKIIIACKYFEKIEFDLCVSIDHDSALMQEWVKAKRKRTRTQKYTEFFLLSNFEKELIYEYYMEDICDCVDLYFPVKKLVIEVDGLVHYIEGKPNAITRLKTFLIEESEYTLVRIDVAKLRSGRCAYLREILSHYMDVCDVEKSSSKDLAGTKAIEHINHSLFKNIKEQNVYTILADIQNMVETFDERNGNGDELCASILTNVQKIFNEEIADTSHCCQYIKDVSQLFSMDSVVKIKLQNYINMYPECIENIFKNMYKHVDRFTFKQYSDVMRSLAVLERQKSLACLMQWLSDSRSLLEKANETDLLAIIYLLRNLKSEPCPEWASTYFMVSIRKLEKMKADNLYKILSCMLDLKMNIPDSWFQVWFKYATLRMSSLPLRYLFNFPFCVASHTVFSDLSFTPMWFEVSGKEMQKITPSVLVHSLYRFVKMEVRVPGVWLARWIGLIEENFYALKLDDIMHILYSLEHLEVDISFTEPLLVSCQTFFRNSECVNFTEVRARCVWTESIFDYYQSIGFDMNPSVE